MLAPPPRADFRGAGRSGAVSARANGGSAASAIPVEQEGDSDSGNPDDFIVQGNPSAGKTAASGKRSLEADVVASVSASVPKRPHRSCTLRPGKRCLNYLYVI